MSKDNKLDFDLYLLSEMNMSYDEFQSLCKQERNLIRKQYDEYLASEED